MEKQMKRNSLGLAEQVQVEKFLATPRASTAMSAENIQNRVNDQFPNLKSQVAKTFWPTPLADDAKNVNPKPNRISGLTAKVKEQNSSGSLNPTWVEWLMGYPIGWTDLED
tara:strand:- start:149 stop:481 length:333 start_codon:yes stop_codon:yes gene_type:complete